LAARKRLIALAATKRFSRIIAMSLEHSPARERARLAEVRFANDDEVLTFAEWCRLNSISPRTGRRILAGPNGPVVTDLTEHRIGITRRANRAWQETRARKR
jgi:hypothetical protein